MQIFSKLQRDSVNSLLIKSILFFIFAIINSEYIFFPLLIGLIAFCDELIISIVYFSFLAVLHYIPLIKGLIFVFFLIFFDFYLKKKIIDYVNKDYQDILSIGVIYFVLFLIMGIKKIMFLYLFYNFLIDVFIYKILIKEDNED